MTRLNVPCAFLLIALTAAAPAARAGDEAMELRPVPAIAKGLDSRIELFSVVIEADPEAAGLTWRPNERCPDEGALELAQVKFKSLVGDRKEWLAGRRADVDALVGHPLIHVRTTHFDLAYDLGEIRVGKKRVGPITGAALYAARLEDHYEWIAETLGIDPVFMKRQNHYEVFLLEKKADTQTLVSVMLGNKLGSGFKSSLVGPQASYFVLQNDPKYIESDEQLHQMLVHGIAHNVYHDVHRYSTWLYDAHGWLYAGLANHDEIRRFGPPITTCDPEDQLDHKHWLSPYWEANIRRAIKQRRDYDPAAVVDLDVETMNAKHRQFAWSYVDFLIWYDAPKMAELLEETKGEGLSSADAIREVYGLDMPTFWAEWKKFVVAKYSSKPRKGPTPARKPRKKS